MFGQSLLSAFGSAACTTDTDQLFATDVQTTSVATYQFNNATTSIPSNTYPGTPSSITYAAGKFGNAAVFNGTSSRIQVGLNIGVTQVSLSFWVKGTTNGSKNQRIIDSSSSNYSGMCQCLLNTSGKLQIARGNNSNVEASVTGNINIGDNSWHHCAVVLNGNSVKTYIDGVSDLNTSTSVALGNDSAFFIGNQEAGTNGLSGSIDQLRIFNTVLPQSAVIALYNETTTTATYPYVDYVGANPNSIAYYKMSDATDQLGNYNGTATNVNFNTEGKFGFAGAFNGSSSYIDTNATFTPDLMSFSAWVKTTTVSPSTANQIISNRDGNSTNYKGVDLGITPSGNIYSRFDNGGSRGSSNSDTVPVPLNTWTHLAFTIDMSNSIQKVYKNGVFVYQETTSGSVATGNDFYIGRYYFSSSDYWQGSIDQVRIFNSAISAANVTTLYNEIECPAVAVTNAFNTVLYTGNGGTQAITGAGFEPDLVWIKGRGAATVHQLTDSVRGVTKNLFSDQTLAEYTETNTIQSFDSDGFTLGSEGRSNGNNFTYVAWNWKSGGADVLNQEGTIDSQVSANVDAGFSIVSYSGTSTSGATIGHGLNAVPEMVILKNLDSSTNWYVYHQDTGTTSGYINYLKLNDSSTGSYSDKVFYPVNFNSSTLTPGYDSVLQGNMIAYCFYSVAGYSKVGSYVGTGATGNVQYLGFEPAFLLVKRTSSTSDWYMIDNKRNPSNPRNSWLNANTSTAEYTPSHGVDFLSNGFSFINTDLNGTGQSWIFLAIA